MTEEQREKVALFRFGVIGSLVSGELYHGELKKKIRELCHRRYSIPYSKRSTIGFGTIEEWLHNFRCDGIEGLRPQYRKDKGALRTIRPELREEIISQRINSPKMSAQTIIDSLIASNKMKPREVSVTNVYRLFQQYIPKRLATKTGKEQKRFVHRYPNDCWQGDTMYGPYIKEKSSGRSRRTYLIAFIDDASRLIVGGEFFFSEETANIKTVLRNAIVTYGVPAKLFLDNGAPYCADDIRIACASLKTALIHTTPYYPQAKGKVERFFRTVRSRFITCLRTVESLNDLNMCFDLWVQNDYNRHKHSSLGDDQTPLQTFLKNAQGRLRRVPRHINVSDLFCRKETRLVAKDATFRINNTLYETEEHLIGKKITVQYDRDDITQTVKVFLGPIYIHTATPIDFTGNAQAKRKPLH